MSADGTLAALASPATNRVAVYDTGRGRMLHEQPCEGAFGGSAFSGDGKSLFVLDRNGPVRRYDARTGKGRAELASTDRHTVRVVPSFDGALAVTQSGRVEPGPLALGRPLTKYDPFVRVHDVTANKVLHQIEPGRNVREFALAGDGLFVLREAEGKGRVLARWNARTGKKEWERDVSWRSEALSVSADGKRVALLHSGSVIRAFDGTTGAPAADPPGHGAPVEWIGWSADGRAVRTAAEDGVMTWNANGERLSVARPVEFRTGWFPPFVPGGALAVTIPNREYDKWELAVWDFGAGAFAWRAAVGSDSIRAVFARDPSRAAVVTWNRKSSRWVVREFSGPNGRERRAGTIRTDEELAERVWDRWPGLAQSADGTKLYLAESGVRTFDLDTGKTKALLSAAPTRAGTRPGDRQLAVSADGARVALIVEPSAENPSLKSVLAVWDVKSGKELAAYPFASHHGHKIEFNATGTRVALVAPHGPVRVYRADANDPPLDFTLEGMRPKCAAFSPNGSLLAVGYEDGTALIWDVTAKPKE